MSIFEIREAPGGNTVKQGFNGTRNSINIVIKPQLLKMQGDSYVLNNEPMANAEAVDKVIGGLIEGLHEVRSLAKARLPKE